MAHAAAAVHTRRSHTRACLRCWHCPGRACQSPRHAHAHAPDLPVSCKVPEHQADSAAGAGFGWANCEAGIVTGETETVERGRLVVSLRPCSCG